MAETSPIKIIQTVASGGTAVLYKAVQTSLDRIVAVKRLHKHLTEDENFTRRFILEAKAAASLDHENIVHVIDFGRDDDGYQIVMEYVEGDSLKDILERWRPIKYELALAIAHQILLGLEHAHAQGIVHRDVKPGNVMVTRGGRVKITDFGLAKLTQAAQSHTADNSILGTPLYMSPEQAFGESVDQRSDLFSLGTVLYEMLTGRQPFQSENYMGVIQNIIHRDIPRLRDLNPEIPAPVEAIVDRALSKDREHRFQSAREFREAIEDIVGIAELRRLYDNLKVLLDRNTATQVLPRRGPQPARQRSAARALLAAALVVVLGGGTVVLVAKPSLVEHLVGTRFRSAPPSTPTQQSSTAADYSFNLGQMIDDEAAARAAADSAKAEPRDTAPAPSAPEPAAPAATPSPTPAAAADKPAAHRKPEPVVRHGYFSVTASPTAEIYVDGKYRGDAPPELRLKLPAGTHRLECRHPGYESYRETLRIVPGELSQRTVTMRSFKGLVSLTAQAGAEVLVDGKLIGVTPLHRPIEVDAGRHVVTIQKAGFNTWSNEVDVSAKTTLPLNITLTRRY